MKRLSPELIDKIQQTKTEEEFAALAKENGIDLYTADTRTRFEWTLYTDIKLSWVHMFRPEVKYDMSAYRFYGDYGTKYDPIPKNFFVFRMSAAGRPSIEFLVHREIAADMKYDLKTPLVKRFIARFARYHNERDMYIGINIDGEPYISSSAIIAEPEKFSVCGVNVVAEKGAFDINDEKDKTLLEKLADRYKNRRVVLAYEGGCFHTHEVGKYPFFDEHDRPADGWEDDTTCCIIPYKIAPRNDICLIDREDDLPVSYEDLFYCFPFEIVSDCPTDIE